MIRLKKLYSTPEVFDPIIFESGMNIILGEKSEDSNKTIGVGKTMSIEFLNYCLLKKASDSRVTLIPDNVIDPETVICLDFTLDDNSISIFRSIKSPETVKIFKNGNEMVFDSVEDASNYLGDLYFERFPVHSSRISFRNLLSPILRDERSEFKDIIKCFDTSKNIPGDFKPHLFFLNLSIDLYSETKSVISEIFKKTAYSTETKNLLTNDYGKVKEAKSRLNELESEVAKINSSIKQLKNNASFDVIQSDLIRLETELKELRTEQKALKYEIKQINTIPEPENISESEITMLFNQFKRGLGDMVEKSLEEVKDFKNRIDSFRKTIVNDKLECLQKELIELNARIERLDESYSSKMELIDNGDLLRYLKTSINVFNSKNQELSTLRTLISRFDKTEKEKKALKIKKTNMIADYDKILSDNEAFIDDFENTILDIHENIMGNRSAHFEIDTYDKARNKDFLSFDLRISDDGSWSTDRMKVFIYDLALMFNKHTKLNHPDFLVHDNIFNVDHDSLERSLNFIHRQVENHPEEFQYILTLNRDMVEVMEERHLLDFDIEEYKRASYTKSNRFLKTKYTQLSRKKT